MLLGTLCQQGVKISRRHGGTTNTHLANADRKEGREEAEFGIPFGRKDGVGNLES